MSLILDHCKPTWDSLATSACEDGTSAAECDAQLARVALAPILIDTTNLTSKDKTTDRDVRAVELAESKLAPFSSQSHSESSSHSQSQSHSQSPSSSPFQTQAHPQPLNPPTPYNRQTYHAHLHDLKSHLAHLPYRDVLRKDYKRFAEGRLALGMSTVTQSFQHTIAQAGSGERGAFVHALRAWAREQAVDVLAVMTVSTPAGGGFQRELLVWGLGGEGVRVVRGFGERFAGRLGLEAWEGGELDEGREGGEEGWRVCWRQREVRFSRKQVAPMLREVMREVAKL